MPNLSPYTSNLVSVIMERSKRLKKRVGFLKQKQTNINHNSMTGTIKTLTDRGFGFISREGEAKDLFFHSKDLQGVTFDELKQGETVSFDVQQGDKGPSAVNVTRA
jgi:cold shock protein